MPEEINYTEYGINNALIIDNIGTFRNTEQLTRHLKANGVSKVPLTAPDNEIANSIHGVTIYKLVLMKQNHFLPHHTLRML